MNQLLAKGYVTALTKLKEELMLLGFISMFLAFTEDYFALLCMPASWMDPSKDTFVAANHADDKQCVATMYHKPGYVKSTADDHRRLMGNDMSTAQRALQWATESGASEQASWPYFCLTRDDLERVRFSRHDGYIIAHSETRPSLRRCNRFLRVHVSLQVQAS